MQILFLGPPGSGKGTQCKKLSQQLKTPHLASGDLLREAVIQQTEIGKLAQTYIDRGNLVPDDVMIKMFHERLAKDRTAHQGFILDGFPRTLVQAKAFDELLKELSLILTVVIDLQIPDHLLVERITGRRICSNKGCNAVFHVRFAPPKETNICDVCGAPLMQRSDDKEELVKERLDIYRKQTEPLINYYDEKLLLRTIDAQGEPEEIFLDILTTLKNIDTVGTRK